MSFQFELSDEVTMGEVDGVVLGRSEYVPACGEPQYFIEFQHPVTRLPTREWFPESQVAGST